MKYKIAVSVFLLISSLSSLAQEKREECPKYEIIAPQNVIQVGGFGMSEIRGDEKFNNLNLSYVWSVSSGEIYSGQGTKAIIIKLNSKEGGTIKATVSIKGLPAGCADEISEDAFFAGEPKPQLVDESASGIPGNLKAGLDVFFSQLQNDPSAEGIIVFKSKTKPRVIEQIRKISTAIRFRGYDSYRLGYRIVFVKNIDNENTAYWIIPSGAVLSSDEDEINIKASEYENIRKFFTTSPRKFVSKRAIRGVRRRWL